MPCAKIVNHGLESLPYIGSKLWGRIPSHMKHSINEFKYVIKTWKPDLCSCRLCKVYLQSIGYLQSGNIYSNNINNNNTYMYTKIHIYLEKSEYHNSFPVCLTLYIYFSLFISLLESMEFI